MQDRIVDTLEVVVGLLGAVALMAMVGSMLNRIKPPVESATAIPITATAISVCAALAETAAARIAAAPEPDAASLGLIAIGQRLEVTDTRVTMQGLWFEVRDADHTGWVLSTDVTPIHDCRAAFATVTPLPTP